MDTRRSNGDDASPSSLSSPPAEADDTTQQQQQQRQSTYSYDYRDPNQSREHGSETLSPLEREVLDEYVKLRDNLDRLSPILANLSQTPTAGILDGLRLLERKTSLVSTLLKASVYSIVLQQEMFEGGEGTEGETGDGEGGSEG